MCHRTIPSVFCLFRLAQTLLHVPSLTWLVVEDSPRVSPRLETILARYPQIHIVVMAGLAQKAHMKVKVYPAMSWPTV